MISCFEGLPGAGKTYDAMRKLLANLGRGRRVVTNISGLENEDKQEIIKHHMDFDDAQIKDLLRFLDDTQVSEFWKYAEPGDLIIIDEAQNFFNSRDWQTKTNREFGKWASEHRHLGIDVVLITQNVERIESSVRSLVEFTYRYKKLNMFGNLLSKKYIRFCYYGPSLDLVGKKTCSYDQKIFMCYKSYFTDGTKEIGIEKPANILKHPIFYALPLVICLFVYFLSQSSLLSGDLFGTQAIADASAELQPNELVTEPQTAAFHSADSMPVNPLKDYTLMGIVNAKKIMKSKTGEILLIP
ncbi:MAG: zonular occludens toxin domain-containing protein [Desulfobacter sp.]